MLKVLDKIGSVVSVISSVTSNLQTPASNACDHLNCPAMSLPILQNSKLMQAFVVSKCIAIISSAIVSKHTYENVAQV